MVESEKMESGAIPWSTYSTYIRMCGGYFFSFFVLLVFIANVSSTGMF